MKKVTLLIILLILLVPFKANAVNPNAPVGPDISYNTCVNFQDSRITTSGDGYFGHCIQATCYTGVWKTAYYISQNMVNCKNGNTDYYYQVVSNGCGNNYSGSCEPTANAKYCNLIAFYDCNKTSDGKVFTTSTTSTTKTTTTKTTTTIKPIIPSKPTKPTTTTSTTTTSVPPEKSNNNYLKSLKFSEGEIKFKKEILEYTLELTEGTTSVEVTAVSEVNVSNVLVENNKPLSVETPIKVIVTSESGEVRVYNIYIKYKEPELDSNNNLESIKITNHKIKFKPNKFNYSIKIKEEISKLDITLNTQSDKATYEIIGNENIKPGSKILIKVTSETGAVKDYIINVKISRDYGLALVVIIVAGLGIYIGFKLFQKIRNNQKGVDPYYEYE